MNIDEIKKTIKSIADAKGWHSASSAKPQTAKNLAISISVEAAELIECFQWSDTADKKNVGEELADIIIFAAQLSNIMGIDLSKEIQNKLEIDKNRSWD